MLEKTKGQARMNNPQRAATMCTQDTGRRQTKQTTQRRKLKRWASRISQKTRGEHKCLRNVNSSCSTCDTRILAFSFILNVYLWDLGSDWPHFTE